MTTKKAIRSKMGMGMGMEYIVETIHEETIKPSSPTPPTLNTFNLSLIDQIYPPMYVSLICWYPNNDTDHDFAKAANKERSQRLKKSLSKTLAHFYPFAGRMSSNNFIQCNDEGVDYIEARVNCLLQDIFKQPNSELLRELIPIPFDSAEAATGRVLLVKVNLFECGGMAIGVCISHKIADMSTLTTFIKSWTAMAQGSQVVLPELISNSSLFPPMDLPSLSIELGEKFPMRRFVIDASKISMLKAKAASSAVPQPTRIEAVTALIWKCAMAAATSNRGGLTHQSAIAQSVNLRKRMDPPLPENSVGNLISGFIAQTPTDYSESTELKGLVQQLRNGIREFSENFVRKIQGGLAISAILEPLQAYSDFFNGKDEVDFYICSSWCRFDLYGGADFGWGRPRWVCQGISTSLPKSIALIDSSDGEGIEAWICLNQDEMASFERNQELLQFADVNPTLIL